MAYLIDSYRGATTIVGGKVVMAKPYAKKPLKWRIRDAWGVLTGKYHAVAFAEDIYKTARDGLTACTGYKPKEQTNG
jgi:hypothetical protein